MQSLLLDNGDLQLHYSLHLKDHWEAWLWIFLDGGVVIAGSLFLITIATQRILSSEAALIGLLEMLFGPLFVFIGVGECGVLL